MYNITYVMADVMQDSPYFYCIFLVVIYGIIGAFGIILILNILVSLILQCNSFGHECDSLLYLYIIHLFGMSYSIFCLLNLMGVTSILCFDNYQIGIISNMAIICTLTVAFINNNVRGEKERIMCDAFVSIIVVLFVLKILPENIHIDGKVGCNMPDQEDGTVFISTTRDDQFDAVKTRTFLSIDPKYFETGMLILSKVDYNFCEKEIKGYDVIIEEYVYHRLLLTIILLPILKNKLTSEYH